MNKTRATFLKTAAVLCAGVMAVCPTLASASGGGYAGSNYEDSIPEGGGYAGSSYDEDIPAGGGYAGSSYEDDIPAGGGYAGSSYEDSSNGGGYAGSNYEDSIPEGGGYAGSSYEEIPEGGGYAGSNYEEFPEGGGYAGSNYTDTIPEGGGYAGSNYTEWNGSNSTDSNGGESNYSGQQVDESELATWKTGLGSATQLDGNIVVVSIFVNDTDYSWDFTNSDDQATRDDSLTYLGIATDWITENAHDWNKDPEFIYNWEENSDLYYEATISCAITDADTDPSSYIAQYIQNCIDEEQLLTKYDAESIVYMTYLNTTSENTAVSYSMPYTDASDYTEEVCYMLLNANDEIECPAGYAHEILHLFGAPDLYTSDDPAYNCNIDGAYVEYCETAHANDIMLTTYDVDTLDTYYDHISNELSDVTAYYIGWTDGCQDVTDYNLQQSQYILTGTYESGEANA